MSFHFADTLIFFFKVHKITLSDLYNGHVENNDNGKLPRIIWYHTEECFQFSSGRDNQSSPAHEALSISGYQRQYPGSQHAP